MEKRKVLAFIDWYRPGYKAGGTITAFGNFVDHLANDFDFKIVTRNVDYQSEQPYGNIEPDKWILNNKVAYFYISKQKLNVTIIKKLIKETESDYIYINGMFSVYFSILPVFFGATKKLIVNPHGMLSVQAFSVKPFKKKLFLWVALLFKLYKDVTFHVSNEIEAENVKTQIKTYKNIVIANQFPRKLSDKVKPLKVKTGLIKLANIARIAKEKGTLIMLQGLQQVQQPMVLDLYGPVYDAFYWEQCQAVIQQLPAHIKVQYQGVLPGEEVPKVLEDYHFMVLLSEGENFGHAIFEAFAAGCPVIISDQTPWRDLQEQKIGWDVPIRDTEAVVRAFEAALLMSAADYEIWSAKAYDFARGFAEDASVLEANRGLFEVL